jgi:hypothetical protein
VFSAGYVTAALDEIRAAGFGGYYWVLDQAEIATDVMFQTRPQLRVSSIAIVAARIGLGLAVTGVIASVGFSAALLAAGRTADAIGTLGVLGFLAAVVGRRYVVYPHVVVGDAGLRVVNPMSTVALPWPMWSRRGQAMQVPRSAHGRGNVVVVWEVQKSNISA